MRTIIATLWLLLSILLLAPVAATYMTGHTYDEIRSTIETEAETEITEITGEEANGNRVLLSFNTTSDFGVAVFSHYGDNYKYEEGTMSNGNHRIDVNLDTGWDIHRYRITEEGMASEDLRKGEGIYRSYGMAAGALAIITVFYTVVQRKRKNNRDNNQ